jgi:hypothetical protein
MAELRGARERARVIVFIVDPACGRCLRGDDAFRIRAAEEFVRYVVVAIERVLAGLGGLGPLKCDLRVLGLPQDSDLLAPGAAMISVFAARLLLAVRCATVDGSSRADAKAVSAALLDVCEDVPRQLGGADGLDCESLLLFLFAAAPATFENVDQFFGAQGGTVLSHTSAADELTLPPPALMFTGEHAQHLGVEGLESLRLLAHSQNALLKAEARLFWIDSCTRRGLRGSDFDNRVHTIFGNWLLSSKLVAKFIYLFALIGDRSILPFSSLVSSIELGRNVVPVGDSGSIPKWWPAATRQRGGNSFVNTEMHFYAEPHRGEKESAAVSYILDLRAVLPAQDLSESGLLRHPVHEEAGALLRPISDDGSRTADTSGHFAGLMLGLAEADNVLIADVHRVSGTTVSLYRRCYVRPLAPLLGCISWLADVACGLDDILPVTRHICADVEMEDAAHSAAAIGRFSGAVFERFIGHGLSDHHVSGLPAEQELRVATGVTHGPPCTIARIPCRYVAEELDIDSGKDLCVSGSDAPGTRAPSAPTCPSATPERGTGGVCRIANLDATQSLHRKLLSSLRDQVLLADSKADDTMPAKAPFCDTLCVGDAGNKSPMSTKAIPLDTSDQIEEIFLDSDGYGSCLSAERAISDLPPESFEGVITTVKQAINFLQDGTDALSVAAHGPADEMESIFAMLQAVWSFVDDLDENEWTRLEVLRTSSRSVKREIAAAKKALLDDAQKTDEASNALQRCCLSAFANAYLQCVLELCKLTRGSPQRKAQMAVPKKAAKFCRSALKILVCVRAESSRLNECFPGTGMLDATFDAFFRQSLNLDAVPLCLRNVVAELWSQNDLDPVPEEQVAEKPMLRESRTLPRSSLDFDSRQEDLGEHELSSQAETRRKESSRRLSVVRPHVNCTTGTSSKRVLNGAGGPVLALTTRVQEEQLRQQPLRTLGKRPGRLHAKEAQVSTRPNPEILAPATPVRKRRPDTLDLTPKWKYRRICDTIAETP